MHFMRRARSESVSTRVAAAGSVLCGPGPNNRGLRLRVLWDQERGHPGPIRGPFLILDAGDNMHADALAALRDRVTDADEVLRAIRRDRPSCVSVANANILAVEQNGAAPTGASVTTKEKAQGPAAGGTVSDPDW